MKMKHWIVRAYRYGVRCAEVKIDAGTRKQAKGAFIEKHPRYLIGYDVTATLAR